MDMFLIAPMAVATAPSSANDSNGEISIRDYGLIGCVGQYDRFVQFRESLCP